MKEREDERGAEEKGGIGREREDMRKREKRDRPAYAYIQSKTGSKKLKEF